MNERAEYQHRRRTLLSAMIDIETSSGLEIGACDLPTVPPQIGNCRYADFRTSTDMIKLWGLAPEVVVPVSYVLNRDFAISDQIDDIFDYIVACHVLEHVPDVIGYLNSLKKLLASGPGKVIFLTLPDKRTTPDATRPSTRIEVLVANFHERVGRPKVEDVMEFHRHWLGHQSGTGLLSIRQAYDYARTAIQSADVDAHCHVWTDSEFKAQVEELIAAGFLPGLELAHYQPNFVGTNEFAIGLRTTDG